MLVLAQYYLPSEKAGGALRTIVNMIERLGGRFRFCVVTRDRDLGDTVGYSSVRLNAWNRVGPAQVFYGSSARLSLLGLLRLVREIRADAVYLNSFFSPLSAKYLFLRRLGLVGNARTIVAPEGELASDALKRRRFRKSVYGAVGRLGGLFENVLWKAAAEHEAQAIREYVRGAREIRIAPNIPPVPGPSLVSAHGKPRKVAGEVRFVFASRIVPIKNLAWLLKEVLPRLDGRVVLDVYGPCEDEAYWAECSRLIRELPAHIVVDYLGPLAPGDVTSTLLRYHFMLLPTLGENFGHIIIEALTAGCPVVISDRTPWRNLAARNVGWDLPLEDSGSWLDVLSRCVEMSAEEYRDMAGTAERYASLWLRSPEVEQDTVDMLVEATSSTLKQGTRARR